MVFMKEFFEKDDFDWKNIIRRQNAWTVNRMQRVKFTNFKLILRLIVGDCCLSHAKSLLHYQVTYEAHSGCVRKCNSPSTLQSVTIWANVDTTWRWLCCYPPTKSEGYSFGIVCLSVHSVRPHFLSVQNNISVPIGQIWFILGTNDLYHELSISYKFGQNRPFNTWVIALVLV